MNEISDKYNIAQYISQTCKVPDHAILQINFKVSNTTNIFSEEALQNKNTTDSNVYQNVPCIRFIFYEWHLEANYDAYG